MASRYVAGVQAAAPEGPVRVAGYCHGGLAALELVRRLGGGRADGGEGRSDRCLLAECAADSCARSCPSSPGWHAGCRAGWAARSGAAACRRCGCSPASAAARSDDPASGDQDRAQRIDARRDASLRTTYYRAMSKYPAAAYPLPRSFVFCPRRICRAEGIRRGALEASGAARTERAALPGQHNTCVSTHVGELAERLNREFAEPATLLK